jgi:hypothetical protein
MNEVQDGLEQQMASDKQSHNHKQQQSTYMYVGMHVCMNNGEVVRKAARQDVWALEQHGPRVRLAQSDVDVLMVTNGHC